MNPKERSGLASAVASLCFASCTTQATSAGVRDDAPSRELRVADGDPELDIALDLALAHPTPRIEVTENGREVAVRWLALTANDSLNSGFTLCFQPIDGEAELDWRDLSVRFPDGREVRRDGHVLLDVVTRRHTLHYSVAVSADDADRIAASTGLDAARYVTRDARIAAEFALEPREPVVSGPLEARVDIVHRSSDTLLRETSVWGGERCTPWQLTLRRDGIVLPCLPIPAGKAGVRGTTREWLAGEVLESKERVDEWFALDTAGEYEIDVEYRLSVTRPLPSFSSSRTCPTMARLCRDVFRATLRFTLTRRRPTRVGRSVRRRRVRRSNGVARTC